MFCVHDSNSNHLSLCLVKCVRPVNLAGLKDLVCQGGLLVIYERQL